jgi:hypothetical protein
MATNGAEATNKRLRERARNLVSAQSADTTSDLYAGDDATVGDDASIGGDLTVTGAASLGSLPLLRLGAHEVVTIASGVATITKSNVWLAAESGTTDQLDTLTLEGAADGDVVLLRSDTGDTITVDDANIDLGAATRAIAPGGCLALIYDGTSWAELFFIAAADNA